jgi:hypothetical protein
MSLLRPACATLLAAASMFGLSTATGLANGLVTPWPAPANPLELTRAAGLTPDGKETLIHHVHSHRDVFVNRRAVRVPAGIGINIRDPGVKVFKAPDGSRAYGGIRLCRAPCISPLHTHDDTGITTLNPPRRFQTGWVSSSPSGALPSRAPVSAAIAI